MSISVCNFLAAVSCGQTKDSSFQQIGLMLALYVTLYILFVVHDTTTSGISKDFYDLLVT